jgi:hypothetical protein
MLVVWGGLDENNTAIVDPPRRLRFDSQTGLFVWSEMTITGTGPSARFGHAAVYDVTTMPDTTFHRMIVFGGVGALGACPSIRQRGAHDPSCRVVRAALRLGPSANGSRAFREADSLASRRGERT